MRASAAARIEMLGGLVEDQHREVGEQGPGHRDALALAARETGTVPADLGGQTPGQVVEPAGQPDPLEDVAQFVVGGVALADGQVLGDGGVEEVGVLADQTDDRAQVGAGQSIDRACRPV